MKELREKYKSLKPKFESLGANLTSALKTLLEDEAISILSINYRIKDEDSFIEKIERKKYQDPFLQVEDFCGIRIICHYQSDVERIGNLIKKEFNVIERQDKEELLATDQFGYRSTHFVITVRDSWTATPNFRKLIDTKCEVQVRTILMHSWAEIQHKLAYKNEGSIPDTIKRKFFRMSAKLEEADEQFEEIKSQISAYRNEIQLSIKNETARKDKLDLNLDSVHAILISLFPDRAGSLESSASLLDDFKAIDIDLNQFLNYYDIVAEHLREIEREEFAEKEDVELPRWYQVGVARTILLLFSNKFIELNEPPESIIKIILKWRKKLNIKPIANKL